jgi:plasmid stabilization system protein ParE
VKVRLTSPAQRQAHEIDRWWRAHREAVDLFARELASAIVRIGSEPETGAAYLERRGALVRRVLLPKTKNHVYYEIHDANDEVMVVAVWGAPKGRGPRL